METRLPFSIINSSIASLAEKRGIIAFRNGFEGVGAAVETALHEKRGFGESAEITLDESQGFGAQIEISLDG